MDETTMIPDATLASAKKPCIALMGEFSAGKSTLSNLLIGQSPLPVKVTATQLPPVRISYGDQPAWREDLDGTRHALDLEDLGIVTPADTRLVQIFIEADLLRMCDLIDMPGISDPNMASEVWEGVIGQANGVIWCTHATQAWRQSEAAVWEMFADDLAKSSLLLLTRFDKLISEADRARVLRRVQRETEDLFAGVYPISLTEAVAGRDDWELWNGSGAEDFSQAFVDLLGRLNGDAGTGTPSGTPTAGFGATRPAPAPDEEAPASTEPGVTPIRPRRVQAKSEGGRSARPASEEDRARFRL